VAADEVDGQDVRAVHEAAVRLIERARKGEGPAFLLCNTYRYRGHHVGDINREYYRSKQEEQRWTAERDPIRNLAAWLTTQGLADQGLLDRISSEVGSEIEKALEFALAAPYPSVDEAGNHVYA
jgi:pyruvate dehydrogenase E1 component alpha subunit